jgi:hypothetical protein
MTKQRYACACSQSWSLIVGEPETFLVTAGLELGYHEGVYRGGTDVLLPAAHTAVRAAGR